MLLQHNNSWEKVIYDYNSSYLLMISASKNTFTLNNLKILRPKVKKILQICLRSFVNPHPHEVQMNGYNTWAFWSRVNWDVVPLATKPVVDWSNVIHACMDKDI